jgi:hypothetical protein
MTADQILSKIQVVLNQKQCFDLGKTFDGVLGTEVYQARIEGDCLISAIEGEYDDWDELEDMSDNEDD